MTFDEFSPLHAEETQFKNRGDQIEPFQSKPERDTKKSLKAMTISYKCCKHAARDGMVG